MNASLLAGLLSWRLPALVAYGLILIAVCFPARTDAAEDDVIQLGSRRELFVDHYLVDRLDNARLQLHAPRDEGPTIKFDKPWEGRFAGYATVLHDGDDYHLYYRGNPTAGADGSSVEVTCYAHSPDGVTWTKPSLGLFVVNGAKENNVILAELAPFSHNFCPMIDSRAETPPEQRFKALAGTRRSGLHAFASPDGVHWSKLSEKPVITKGAFDSQNVPLWSAHEQKYLCFLRVFKDGFRRVARCESEDFLHWSEPVLMEYGDKPIEHLYTNQTSPYFRAPHIYLAIAARFLPGRRVLSAEQAKAINVHPKYFSDCSDGVLMTTRGGNRYDRTFMEGFLRPGVGLENWVSRTNYPALNIVPAAGAAGEKRMHLYVNQNYGQLTAHLRRYSLRLDGFASVHADYEGGELRTKPFTFTGKELALNFATSAAGGIRVEIQDEKGKPIEGFTLADCQETIGNEIERVVRWKQGADVGSLAGRTVRLRIALHDADLFALRFRP